MCMRLVPFLFPASVILSLFLAPLPMVPAPMLHLFTMVLYLHLLELTALDKKTAVEIMDVALGKEIVIATATADEG